MKRIRVLIVEDEPIIAADLEDRLIEMGYLVAQVCHSGEDALSFLQQNIVDLVLMDIQLDGQLDGVETATKIRESLTLPIIYLTSNTDESHFNRARLTHPSAYLSKPFRGKDLKHAIELALVRIPSFETMSTNSGVEEDAYLFSDRLFVKTKDRMVRFFIHEIQWLEADDYYCRLKTHDKEILVGQTLKQMGETLSSSPAFMRVHRSFIVNLAHVEEIGDLYLIIDNRQIPINKTSKDEITARLRKI